MERHSGSDLEIRLLGTPRVLRADVEVPLPRSRKVRALLALLALARSPVSRSRLCDLLWDVPSDPKGELRWCLSKLRAVLDDQGQRRVTSGPSGIALDMTKAAVDTSLLEDLCRGGVTTLTTECLEAGCQLVRGSLLEGTEIDSVEFTGWLNAQRQHFHSMHVALLQELATRTPGRSEQALERLGAWLQHAPFELRAHKLLLEALIQRGRRRDAEAHVRTTIRAYDHEGVDWGPLRDTWRACKMEGPLIELSSTPAKSDEAKPVSRGSVVVMPFSDTAQAVSQVGNGLTDDIITHLAKLRVFFVIARGTSYALRDRGVDPSEAGKLLDVEYVVSGVVRREGNNASVLVELAESRSARIVWAEEFAGLVDETFSVLDSIVARIVAAISEEIEREERKRAILKQPNSLDAWEHYHRGLWHMYRFTSSDNEQSAHFFRQALARDPTFARAHAGLSFTHFQNVFLELTPDRDQQMALALDSAGQSLAVDDRDPAAHWAMGRALWLKGELGESLAELERSVELSPSFALGHYTLGFIHAQSGEPSTAIEAADYSRKLSPFDPLQFGMLGSRALAHMRLGEREAAAEWAVKAASRPNAHAHILAIAATNLALTQRKTQAREFVARIRSALPAYTVEDFLRAFRFLPETDQLFRYAARRIGFE